MKVKYTKFSDERSKEFCIKTVIAEENNALTAYKKAIYPEGNDHVNSFEYKKEQLDKYYDIRVCDVKATDGKAVFEYISGELLEDRYRRAADVGDKETFKTLLHEHKKLALGKAENQTVFCQSNEYIKVFGDGSSFDGKPALRLSNYDAIASNIVYMNDEPVFIDYEWVFDFLVPQDVVIYHCIKDMYIHHSRFEKLYSFEDAMKELNVETDLQTLEDTYRSFYDYVICGDGEDAYAVIKAICLKNSTSVEELAQEKIILSLEHDRLQGVIKDLTEKALESLELKMQLDDVRKELQKVAEEAFVKQHELKSMLDAVTAEKDEYERKYNRTVIGATKKIVRKMGVCNGKGE